MNEDCLKLTLYFGERDRTGGRLLADALLDVYEQHAFAGSVLLRGVEGFGIHHRLHTVRLLTLSEDLPIVAIAVDTRERIQRALPEVLDISSHGLITLERARLLTGHLGAVRLPEELHEATKLTISVGRLQRIGPRPAYLAIVDLLHGHGVAGATVFLGVDGTRHGQRRRARFFGRNADVPMVIVAVGTGASLAGALPELNELTDDPLVMLERVRVLKRDGQRLADPGTVPATDSSGLGLSQKLMIYTGEQAKHGGRPLYVELIRRLREANANGATALRGIWGYHGDHKPHGDALVSIQRRVPVVTSIVDTPERICRWLEIVDEVTDEAGLVTSEIVPAVRASGPNIEHGGLALAAKHDEGPMRAHDAPGATG